MKICSIITGVIRPNVDRVFENIKTTLSTLSDYNCTHYALTYETEEYKKLKTLIDNSDLNIELISIDPILETIGNYNGNNYRMFRCIEILCKHVDITEGLDSFDCIIRHRIDCELNSIEIPSIMEHNTWYAPDLPWGIFDNIGITSPDIFRKIFTTQEKTFLEKNPHDTLDASIGDVGVIKKPFNFKKTLYQSNDEFVMGVRQWSRKNRVFEYDGKWVSIH